MVSLNDQLLDDAIRHAIAIERFKAGEARRVLAFLRDDLFADLVAQLESQLARSGRRSFGTKRYEAMIKAIKKLIGVQMKASGLKFSGSMRKFAVSEARIAAAFVDRRLAPIGLTLRVPSTPLLHSIVTSEPMRGELLSDWFGNLGQRTGRLVTQQVNIGIAQGEHSRTIVRRLIGQRGLLRQTRRELQAVVRTAVNHVSAHARESTFAANDDVVKKVRYVATLDSRTTEICASLDGRVFPINEGERPPMHFQCRSTVTPILKSWKELLGSKRAKELGLKEAPPGFRASANGQVPSNQTYGEWLKRQPVSVQNEALGPRRAALFREGLDIRKFVDQSHRPLTLSELQALLAA